MKKELIMFNFDRINLLSRRHALKYGGVAFMIGVMGESGRVNASLTVVSSGWRFCNKCQVLFNTRYGSGNCASGGTHIAQGYKFFFPLRVPGTPTAQTGWCRCTKCQAMFFNGYRGKGRCAAGGVHKADTNPDFNHAIPHDIPGTPTNQTDWRFCNKCYTMFYDGYTAKGICAAAGSHQAQGYNFVLPHDRP
jgi:hypothetical protein